MNRQLYWCDVCSVNTVDCKGNEGKEYYSCYSGQAWIKHIKSSKHIKQIKLNESLTVAEGGVKCKHCSKTFTTDGYVLHEERNKSLWDCYKTTEIDKMTCNNFCVGKKRYESIEEYKQPKKKEKRVKVGSFSPVTQTTRPPNTKGGRKKQSITIISNSDSDSEEDTTEQDLLEIEQLKKQYYIDKAQKQEQKDKEEAEEKKKLDNNPYLKRLMESVDNVEIKRGLELTIEEIDYTERPQFDEDCDDCGLPINYDVSINIINKWEIDSCCCEETDSDED